MNLIGLIATTRRSLPRVLPLFRDARVPKWLKIATVVSAVLIISPLDLLSDIPILGLFDDLTLLALLASGFVALAKRFERVPVTVNVTPAMSARGVLPN